MGQLYLGVLAKSGWSGMWIFWVSVLGSFVIPLVFAPMWYKLQLETDNQFYLIRYPGKWGKFLHLFRVGYVGIGISAFLVSFNVLSFARLIAFFFQINQNFALLICGGLLVAYILINPSQVHRFWTHSMLALVIGFCMTIFYVLYNMATSQYNDDVVARDLFPTSSLQWNLFWTYVGILWWSTGLFDGGGKETPRFVANSSTMNTIKAALVPVIGQSMVSILTLILCWFLLQQNTKENINESDFVPLLMDQLPVIGQWMIVLGFTAMFLSSALAQLNWGASLIMIDGFKTYGRRSFERINNCRVEIGLIVFLAVISLLIAWQADGLMTLTQWMFSISAGVAPFYILRWFWWRISALSQWLVMVCSALFTLTFEAWINWIPFLNSVVLPHDEKRMAAVTCISLVIGIFASVIFPSDRPKQSFIDVVLPLRPKIVYLFLAIGIGILFLLLKLSFLVLII
jgi:SSS family solute:Na+ symporter